MTVSTRLLTRMRAVRFLIAVSVTAASAVACAKPGADASHSTPESAAQTPDMQVIDSVAPATAVAGATPAPATPAPATPAPAQTGTPPQATSTTPRTGQPTAASTNSTVDTLRGVVQRVGNDPVSVVVLQVGTGDKKRTFALHGSSRTLLERVAGLEINASGRLTGESDLQAAPRGAPVFDVSAFEVRASEGVSAIDGVIGTQNGAYYITTQSGTRINTPNLPANLRDQIGARVFLVGSMQTAPAAFGIIVPKR